MRRALYLVSLLFVCLISFGQEKEFKAAMKNGPDASGYYSVDLSKKGYSYDTIEAFAKSHGYACRNMVIRSVPMFGAMMDCVTSLEFTPSDRGTGTVAVSSDVESRMAVADPKTKKVLHTLVKGAQEAPESNDGTHKARFENDGTINWNFIVTTAEENGYFVVSGSKDGAYYTAYYLTPAEEVDKLLEAGGRRTVVGSGYAYMDEKFQWRDDIAWTENLSSDGKITGTGKGMVRDDGKTYVFSGAYADGKPSGTIGARSDTRSGMFGRGTDKRYEGNIQLSQAGEGMIWGSINDERWNTNHYSLFDDHYNFINDLAMTERVYYDYSTGHDKEAKNRKFEILGDFHNGYALVRNKTYQLDFKVDHDCVLSYTDDDLATINSGIKDVVKHWDSVIGSFKQGRCDVPSEVRASSINTSDDHWRFVSVDDVMKSDPDYPKYQLLLKARKLQDYLWMDIYKDTYLSRTQSAINGISDWDISKRVKIEDIMTNGFDYGESQRKAANSLARDIMNDPLVKASVSETSRNAVLAYVDKNMDAYRGEYEDTYYAVQTKLKKEYAWMDRLSEHEVIDFSRNTYPSGMTSAGFLSDGYVSETAGKVYFLNSYDYVEYSAHYDDNKEFEYYTFVYGSFMIYSKRCQSLEEVYEYARLSYAKEKFK